jgi:hypothetical protein
VARDVPARDPRYRPFRVAAYLVYLVLVSAFCILVIISVVRSVGAMTPRLHPVRGATLEPSACAALAQMLFQELEQHRRELSIRNPAASADAVWNAFRVAWLERVRQAQSNCGVAAPERAAVARLFVQLEHLEDLYTTSSVQFSGEIGPAVDAFRRSLEALRR